MDKTKIVIGADVKAATKTLMESGAFDAQTSVYRKKSRPELRTFLNYLYTACVTYVKHGNVAALNKALMAGHATSRFRIAKRVCDNVCGHPFSQEKGYHGSRNKGDFKRKTREGYEDRIRETMQAALDADGRVNSSNPEDFDLNKKMKNLIKKGIKVTDGKLSEAQASAVLHQVFEELRLEARGELKAVA